MKKTLNYLIFMTVTINSWTGSAFALRFTLSDTALMQLESSGTAELLEKRNTPGPGVEFDLLFSVASQKRTIRSTINVVDLDLSGYDHFDLRFTLLAIHGDSTNEYREIISAAAFLSGWRPDGTYTGNFNPITLRLNEGYEAIYDQSFSSSGISSTLNASGYSTSYESIEAAGLMFYLASAFDDSWINSDEIIATILVEPAAGADVIPEPATLFLFSLGAILIGRKRTFILDERTNKNE